MNYLNNLQLMAGLFLPLFLGMLLYKRKLVDDNFSKGLSAYLYNIALPCSILESMRVEISGAELLKSFWLPVICIVSILVFLGLGKLVARFVEPEKSNRGLLVFGFMFSNFTFTAYPILTEFYGKEAVFFASLFNIGMFLGVLTIGAYVIRSSSKNQEERRMTLKDLFSVPFLSLLIGMGLMFVPLEYPYFITSSLSLLSATTAPIGILLTGIVAAKKKAFPFLDGKAWIVSLFRLVVIPILALLLLKIIGFDGHMVYVPVIILANPIAVNLVMFAENFDAPSEIGANYVVLSSILSVVTIPLIRALI